MASSIGEADAATVSHGLPGKFLKLPMRVENSKEKGSQEQASNSQSGSVCAWGADDGEAPEPPFKTWTHEEAEALRAQQPLLSPWWVVAAQAVAGGVCFAVAQSLAFRPGVAGSVLYGAAVAVVSAAVLARGMTRNRRSAPGAAVVGFMFWEALKIGVAVAMLLAAPHVVRDISWPALLAGLVICTKVNWLALLWRRRAPDNVAVATSLKT